MGLSKLFGSTTRISCKLVKRVTKEATACGKAVVKEVDAEFPEIRKFLAEDDDNTTTEAK